MDACPDGQTFQDRKRGDNRVQRLVQLSLRVADGMGVGKRRVTGNDPENSLNGGTGIYNK